MEKIVVWFSCGAASAVAAKLTLETYPDAEIHIVNNPVYEEDEDNRRFLHDVEKWLGVDVEIAVNNRFPESKCQTVWENRKFMSGPLGAPCTIELKKEARRQWETVNKPDWHVLGFTKEETKRFERFQLGERSNTIPILIDHGYSKQDCVDYLISSGIELPRVYGMGYPNANCIGCVKATSPTYWNHVRDKHPDVFEERAKLSRKLGAKLVRVNNTRIFLDELDKDAKGRSMKTMDTDCGIFCEEKPKG